MMLDSLIAPDHVFSKLKAHDKPRLLSELAARAAAAIGRPPVEITELVLARESLGSTGVGHGIGVPHARVAGLDKLVGFFARLDRAVDYEAIDGKPVDLVFLLLSPAARNAEHLAGLAAVSRRLRDLAVADSIRAAGDAASMRAVLVGSAPAH